ncbi:MAG: polysaccharide deacetylase family protein [Deltaproteobacteria bacterium]|nr:polysaccharide deacetylase family protein [Deltaproteobacteria bacterium]
MNPVPVFMYHHVSPHKGDMVTVTPDVFEAQMRFLKEAGYRTLSVDELVEIADGNLEIKEKAVVVTFDDGYLDNYVYAFPVLKKYNIKATIFVVTDWVEKSSEFVGAYGHMPPLHNHGECKRLINEGKLSVSLLAKRVA